MFEGDYYDDDFHRSENKNNSKFNIKALVVVAISGFIVYSLIPSGNS